jgi:Ca-activated chloride channel family protein
MNSTNPHGSFGCDSFAEELSLFVFGELDGERRDALERHLVDCAACRGERDALVRSLEILKQESARVAGEAAPQLSPARQANLLAQAQATAPKRGPVIAWRRAALAAGVIATVGAGAFAWRASQYGRRACELTVADRGRSLDGSDAEARPTSESTDQLKSLGYLGGSNDDEDDRAGSEAPKRSAATAAEAPAPKSDPATVPVDSVDLYEQLKREQSEKKTGGEAGGDPASDAMPKSPILTALPVAQGGGGTHRGPGDGSPSTRSLDGAGAHAGPKTPATNSPQPAPAPTGDRSAIEPFKEEEAASEVKPQAETAKRKLGTGMKKGSAPAGPASSGAPKPEAKKAAHGELDVDVLGNNTADYGTSFEWANNDSCLFVGLDGRAEGIGADGKAGALDDKTRDALRKLGYDVPDVTLGTGGAHAVVSFASNLDPASLGQMLAASLSPAQAMRVQALIVAKLGTAPGQPPRPGLEADRDVVVREFLDRLSRRQSEPPRDMFFRYFGDHPFIPTRIDAKSTFGMDVDTASYALARAYLSRGTLPPKAAVRTEEFVNAFRHDLATPDADGLANAGRVRDDDRPAAGVATPAARDVFAIHTEIAPSPFGDEGHCLLQIGLKAREIPRSQRKPIALTFVIDVSGSMEQDGRLELVKKGLHLLLDQLTERDTVGIVSFESTGHRVLDPIDATQRDRIFSALDRLRPEGSTNVDQGLRLGYEMALSQLRPNAENRVVLCSDGVANTGVTDAKWLSARIAECKSKYVYLNCIGVGMGNHNDALMEQLADEGDGFCAYIDRIEEAKKLFVDRLTGTLLTVARNAKIQVEFDPAGVRRFRQLGYENRALAHRDFRNDRVDAGEVGAGQEVVALYEVELARDALARDAGARDTNVPLAAVRVRYEDPDAGAVREQERRVAVADLRPTLQQATPRFRLSACVAEFAEILRLSVHARDGSLGAVERLAEPLVDELPGDPDVPEFVALVKQAARLPDLIPVRSGLTRACDEVKRFHCWREELHDGATDEQLRQLEEQNRRLEQALRDALDRALRGS